MQSLMVVINSSLDLHKGSLLPHRNRPEFPNLYSMAASEKSLEKCSRRQAALCSVCFFTAKLVGLSASFLKNAAMLGAHGFG